MPNIKITLTREELHGILLTAGEHGCGYWARTICPLTAALTAPVTIYDSETWSEDEAGPALGVLTRSKLKGAATLMANYRPLSPDIRAQLIDDPAAMDACAADVFVQLAVFGEVRYG